ncbi:MAG: ATP-grasp domain-containing protein [Methylobacter sp.]
MKIWILTHLEDSPDSPSVAILLAAARKMGHDIALVHPSQCHVPYPASLTGKNNFGSTTSTFYPELILTRLGASAPEEALHLLKCLEFHAIPCINSSLAFSLCRDKISSYRKLSEFGVPIPKTLFLASKASLDEAIKIIHGPPWIVKLPMSSHGKGVLIADSYRSLKSNVDVLHNLEQHLILQEAITEANGRDIRVLVLGGHAVVAVQRQATGDDFRSNLHLGGTAKKIPLTTEIRQIAEQAAKALYVDIAGVDILQSRNGPVVIEVNGSPGLLRTQQAADMDLASEVIAFSIDKVNSLDKPPAEF